jgi:hypothetical protein
MTSQTVIFEHENGSCREIREEKTELTHENSGQTVCHVKF